MKKKFKDPRARKIMVYRTKGGFCIKIWSFHMYFSNVPLKPRTRNSKEKDKNRLRIIRLSKLHEGTGCELCGTYLTAETSELHHIKPVSLFPELKYAPDNLMLVCNRCHTGLHNAAQKKANELLADGFKTDTYRSV